MPVLTPDERLLRALDHIDKYYAERLDGRVIAENLCYWSQSTFSHQFSAAFGVTFVDYVTSRRIVKAKELLCDPRMQIQEVSVRVGYDDPSYFTRMFRRLVGMSPSTYRALKMAAPKVR